MSSEAAQVALRQINSVIDSDEHSTVVILGGGHPSRRDVAKMTLESEVANEIFQGAADWLRSLADTDLIRYEVGNFYVAESDSAYLRLEDLGDSASLLTQITDIHRVPSYSNDSELLHSASFLAVVVQSTGQQLVLFKHLTPTFILNRSGMRHRFLHQNGRFSRLDEVVVQFNDKYDCVAASDHLFIVNRSGFEKIFGFGELKVEHARGVLRDLVDILPFSDPDLFIDACLRDQRLHKKVESMMRRDVYRSVSLDEIEKVAIARKLPVAFETDASGCRIIMFDGSRASRRAILALLDDDHVQSVLTGNPYEATSKRDLSSL